MAHTMDQDAETPAVVRLTPTHAGRIANLTPAAIKYHDAELKPEIDSNGRRTYRLDVVLAFAAERAAAKAGR